MKKALFTVFAMLMLPLAIFAASSTKLVYHTKVEPITAATLDRKDLGPATDIVVINYTPNIIVLNAPTYNVLTTKTSARIKNDFYDGDTQILLSDANSHQILFDRYVSHHATVSVDVGTNGQYVVNVTN